MMRYLTLANEDFVDAVDADGSNADDDSMACQRITAETAARGKDRDGVALLMVARFELARTVLGS